MRSVSPLRAWSRRCVGLAIGLALGACGPEAQEPAPSRDEAELPSPPPRAPEPPRDPAAARAARAEARIHQESGDRLAAIAALERAHGLDPRDAAIGLELAELLLGNGAGASPARAWEVLERSQSNPPEGFAAQLAMARAAFRTHRAERCRRLVQSWFERGGLPPAVEVEARYLLGSLAERDGDFTQARQQFARALELAPRSGLHRCRLAVALEELGEEALALKEYERATQDAPGLGEAFWRLSTLYARLDRREDAARCRAIHAQLNRLVDSRAQTEEAYRERYAALQELARIHPDHADARAQLMEYQLRFDDDAAAAATGRALVADHPAHHDGWRYLILALRRTEGDQGARRALSGLLAELPDLPVEKRDALLEIVLKGFPE